MQDSKDIDWSGEYGSAGEDKEAGAEVPEPSAGGNSADGWQQYRRWISKAPAPRQRRSSIDPSLYTWKGYRNWTEQIKRNWSDN